MSWRFQVSKFKNAAPKIPKREQWITGINAGRLMQSQGNHIAASATYMVFNTQDAGVGSIGILPVDAQGRQSNIPSVRGHSDFVSYFEFSPFDDNLLSTGSYDGTVKVWRLPENVTDDVTEYESSLPAGDLRIDVLAWHPTAAGLLTVAACQQVKIWDVENAKAPLELSLPEQILSLSWCADGKSLAVISKDKTVRIFDARQQSQILEFVCHDSLRDSRVLWCGDTDTVLSTGCSSSQDRQLCVWDIRKTNEAVDTLSCGTGTAALMPFYDESTGMLFVTAKGDRTIRYCEVTNTGNVKENSSDLCEQVKGLCMVPKRAVAVMECEVNRLLLLSQSNIISLPYHVPRKSYREFHADLFPEILSDIPANTAATWLSGDNSQVKRISLDPSKPGQTAPVNNNKILDDTKPLSKPVTTGLASVKPAEPANDDKDETNVGARVIPGQSILKPVSARNEPASNIPGNDGVFKVPDRTLLRPVSRETSIEKTASENFGEVNNSKFESARTTFQRLESRESMRRKNLLNGAGDENGYSGSEESPSTPRRVGSGRKFKGFRMCKFRHLEGKVLHKSTHIENIRNLSQNVSGESDGFCCNGQRCAVPLKGTSGLVAVLDLSQPGRLSDTDVPCVENGGKVSDFAFDPFDASKLVCACDDGSLRLWRVPESGLTGTVTEPETVVPAHLERLYFIKFHPLARDVLASTSFDMSVKIWNLATKKCPIELKGHTDVIFNLAWSPDGRRCVTACKDGKLRIYEPRKSETPILEGECEKNRGGRVVWACQGKYIIYVCFSKQNQRLVNMYKADDLSRMMASQEVGITPAILVPHYDEDSSTLFLVGRGESSVYAYEVAEDSPHLFPLSTWKADSLHQSLAFLTKQHCDVRAVEFAKGYRLTNSTVEPVSFSVPRVKAEYFQDDLFPDTRLLWQPTMEAADWFSDSNTQPKIVSLRPSDMKKLSDMAVMESPKPRKYEAFNPAYKTDEEKKEELVSAMMSKMTAARRSSEASQTRSSVTDDDWDD